MQTLGLLVQDPSGKTMLHKLLPVEGEEVKMPQGLSGPFIFEFGMDDGTGMKRFDAKLMLSDSSYMIAFRVFPVLAATIQTMMPTSIIDRITERESQESPVRIFGMNIKEVYQDGDYVVIQQDADNSPTVFIANDKCETFTIPFYNFYENASICTGQVSLRGSVWDRMQALIAARTTPHQTYADKSIHFRPKDGRIIKDNGGKVKNAKLDLPEVQNDLRKLLTQRPFGKIEPI